MRLLTSTILAVALGAGGLAAVPTVGLAQFGFGIGITVGLPPPPLPVYDQPPIPDYGYIWTPGYWAWDADYGDFYWVPGTWALPPDAGLLWTPAWWGWSDGVYAFHPGYWGPHIGYYGGIDYGYGYTGYGYQGGYWRGREFFYNRAVNNVRNVRITNVFVRPVIGPPRADRTSFSGGVGGVAARPTPEQLAAMRERHVGLTPDQARHVQMAGSDRSMLARVNHGAPPVVATPRPAAFDQARAARGYPAYGNAAAAYHPSGPAFAPPPGSPRPGYPPPRMAPPHIQPPSMPARGPIPQPTPRVAPVAPTPAHRPPPPADRTEPRN